jgi:WD40 repeat protein
MGNERTEERARLIAHGRSARALAVDAARAHWIDAGGSVLSARLSDGAVAVLRPRGKGPLCAALATDGAHVYWLTTDGALCRAPSAGGEEEVLAQGVSARWFALHAGCLFWVDGERAALAKMPASGGEPAWLVRFEPELWSHRASLRLREGSRIAAGGEWVVWTAVDTSQSAGAFSEELQRTDRDEWLRRRMAAVRAAEQGDIAVWKVPVSGGDAEIVSAEDGEITALVADGESVVWRVRSDSVRTREDVLKHARLRGGAVEKLPAAPRAHASLAADPTPGLAGAALLAEIPSLRPSPFLLALAGWSTPGARVQCLAAGPLAFVWSTEAGNLFAWPRKDPAAVVDLANRPEESAPPPPPEGAPAQPTWPLSTPPEPTSTQGDFEDRVALILRAREAPGRPVERVRAAFAAPFRSYFRVPASAGKASWILAVAAVERPDGALVDALSRAVALDREKGVQGEVLVVHGNGAPLGAIPAEAQERLGRVRFEELDAFRGTPSWADVSARQRELVLPTRRHMAEKFEPELFEPLRARRSEDGAEIEDAAAALVELLTGPRGAFVLLVGEDGAGKTFVLREALRAIEGRAGGPAVLFVDVEMAWSYVQSPLEPTIDDLLAAHFRSLELQRADVTVTREALAEGRAVLILDHAGSPPGADHAGAPARLAGMWRGLPATARVAVACRTTDFASRDAEIEALRIAAPDAATVATWQLLPLSRDQIRSALRRRVPGEADVRFAAIDDHEDLRVLAQTPALLGAFADMPGDGLADAEADSLIAACYGFLVRYLRPTGQREHLPHALAVARWMWTEGVERLWRMELPEPLLHSLRLHALHRPRTAAEAARAAGSCGYMTRDAQGWFTFVRPSFAEWLLVDDLASRIGGAGPNVPVEGQVSLLRARRLSPRMARFLAGSPSLRRDVPPVGFTPGERSQIEPLRAERERVRRLLVEWARIAAKRRRSDPIEADNARAILAALGEEAPELPEAPPGPMSGGSFAGRSLRGADLRDRDLRDADLTGADLCFADLTGADLRGAKLEGARLCAAKLIKARLDPGALDACDTLGAALSIPERVEPCVAFVAATKAAAFHPSGLFVATGHDSRVNLWDAETGACLRSLRDVGATSIAFSPDGALLAAGYGTLQIHEVGTGRRRASLRSPEWITALAFGPDGRRIAAASRGRIRIYETATLKEELLLTGDAGSGFTWSADGARIALSWHRTVRIWDAESGAVVRQIEAPGSVSFVALSRDGRVIAGVGQDGYVYLWDVGTGDLARSFRVPASVRGAAFTEDLARLAVAANDHALLVDVASGAVVHTLRGGPQRQAQIGAVALSRDGGALASISLDYTEPSPVSIWDAGSGELRCALQGQSAYPGGMVFSDDGGALVVHAVPRHTPFAWDVATHAPLSPGRATGLLDDDEDPRSRRLPPALENEMRRHRFGATIQGGVVALGDPEEPGSRRQASRVRLLDASTGAERASVPVPPAGSWSLRPDGARLVTSDPQSSTLGFWDTATGELLFGIEKLSLSYPVFSRDSKLLLSGSPSGWLLDAETGDVLTWIEVDGRVQAVQNGGALLAGSSSHGTACLWDRRTGACLAELLQLPEGWAAFTEDGHVKHGGALQGRFWHAIGLCRFEPGELDPHLAAPLKVPVDQPLPPPRTGATG